jgi:hypothetical protein
MQKSNEDFLNEMKELAKENDGKLIDTEWRAIYGYIYLFKS